MPAFLEAYPAMRESLAIHRLEGVFVGEPDSGALLFAVNARVGVVALVSGARASSRRPRASRSVTPGVGAERHPLLLARPVRCGSAKSPPAAVTARERPSRSGRVYALRFVSLGLPNSQA